MFYVKKPATFAISKYKNGSFNPKITFLCGFIVRSLPSVLYGTKTFSIGLSVPTPN